MKTSGVFMFITTFRWYASVNVFHYSFQQTEECGM